MQIDLYCYCSYYLWNMFLDLLITWSFPISCNLSLYKRLSFILCCSYLFDFRILLLLLKFTYMELQEVCLVLFPSLKKGGLFLVETSTWMMPAMYGLVCNSPDLCIPFSYCSNFIRCISHWFILLEHKVSCHVQICVWLPQCSACYLKFFPCNIRKWLMSSLRFVTL